MCAVQFALVFRSFSVRFGREKAIESGRFSVGSNLVVESRELGERIQDNPSRRGRHDSVGRGCERDENSHRHHHQQPLCQCGGKNVGRTVLWVRLCWCMNEIVVNERLLPVSAGAWPFSFVVPVRVRAIIIIR